MLFSTQCEVIDRLRRLLLAALAAGALLAAPIPPAARAEGEGLEIDQPALGVELPLGQQKTVQVNLTNRGGQELRPQIYEAQPNPEALGLSAAGPGRVALPPQRERVDRRLLAQLRSPGDQADFLIVLGEQADLSAAYRITDWAERGRYVYRTLVSWAEQSQAGLRRELDARGLAYRPFWIVNAVLAHGSLADVQAAAARAEVAQVRANSTQSLPSPAPADDSGGEDRCSPDAPGNPVCWNIRAIRADAVWRTFGVTGAGVVVAGIDTGVGFENPALAAQYRGAAGDGRYDHDYNWFDPQGLLEQPTDPSGHGTHTMGTIVARGDGSAAHPAVGIAPGARWIAARGCAERICSDSDLIAAAQWVLAPTRRDRSEPRPDLRPMVVNNSWGGRDVDLTFDGYIAAWRAAGIFPVFAAGNLEQGEPQACGTLASPGDSPQAVAVGAVDAHDQIAPFSRLGGVVGGRAKPDVTAPGLYTDGQGVLSAAPRQGYFTLGGTSMAAPHVAGLVALLWSANPTLIGNYEATYALLRDTAQRISDTRCGDAPGAPNSVYGGGRIDAFAAVERARVDLPWVSVRAEDGPIPPGGSRAVEVAFDGTRVPGPGRYSARLQIFSGDLGRAPLTVAVTLDVSPAPGQASLRGRVVSGATGGPVSALVSADGGLPVPTDSGGAYALTLVPGQHQIRIAAAGYQTSERTVAVSGDLDLPDAALAADQPRLSVPTPSLAGAAQIDRPGEAALRIRNDGTRTLYYQVQVPHGLLGAWRSDQQDGPAYRWVDLPADAPVIPPDADDRARFVELGFAFPFMGGRYASVMILSDGSLAFVVPRSGAASRACVAGSALGSLTIAPLRADFDPALGGRVRYGVYGGAFVVSYEGVRRSGDPAGEGSTFQVLLQRDGRIVFQYQHLAGLPATLSAGAQGDNDEPLLVGCGAGAQLRGGLAVELRPQPDSALWLSAAAPDGSVPPGEERTVPLTFTWIPPGGQPFHSAVRLLSSDPLQPRVSVPVQFTPAPAPRQVWVPVAVRG
jgi:subtilisin family serine protease